MEVRFEVTMEECEYNEYGFEIIAELICDADPAVPQYRWKGHAEVTEWNPQNVIVYDNMGNVIPLEIPDSVIDEQGNKWLDKNEEKITAQIWETYERENAYHDG